MSLEISLYPKCTVKPQVRKFSSTPPLSPAGISLTGMYINPANATVQTFGCQGSQAWEHITVYWLGPFSGTWLALQLYHQFNESHFFERLIETPLVTVTESRPIFMASETLPAAT